MIVRVFVAARLHCSALVRSSDEIEALMRSTAGAFQAAHSAKARAAASSGQEGRARPRSPGPDLAAWTSVGLAAGVEAPKEPGPEDCCVRLVFLIPQFSSMSIDVFTPRRSNVGARTVFGMSIWRPRSSMRGAFSFQHASSLCVAPMIVVVIDHQNTAHTADFSLPRHPTSRRRRARLLMSPRRCYIGGMTRLSRRFTGSAVVCGQEEGLAPARAWLVHGWVGRGDDYYDRG